MSKQKTKTEGQPKKKAAKRPAKKKAFKKPSSNKSKKSTTNLDKNPETSPDKQGNNPISEIKRGGAPLGNQFWKLRSKHGRDKLFAAPELMREAAEEYFQWCIDNPINDPRSFAGLAMIPRPFTIHGLTAYLGVNTLYFRDFKESLKPNENEQHRDFSLTIRYIEETIFRQKFEGAAVGIYKENFIARDLGINDKVDVTSKGDKINSAPPVVQVFSGAPPMAGSENEISEDKTDY